MADHRPFFLPVSTVAVFRELLAVYHVSTRAAHHKVLQLILQFGEILQISCCYGIFAVVGITVQHRLDVFRP